MKNPNPTTSSGKEKPYIKVKLKEGYFYIVDAYPKDKMFKAVIQYTEDKQDKIEVWDGRKKIKVIYG